MVKSAYIHIPFCKSKCNYCSFVSFNKLGLKQDYISALIKEIQTFYEQEPLNTLYFGGGTPSILEASELLSLIELFKFSQNPEITIEINPEDVTLNYIKSLYGIGVNRISLGCQTFDDNILKVINRRHSATKVKEAVEIIQNVGFDNVSLDFIYGLPNQTPEMFYKDLKLAVELGIQHISLYGLKIEKDCYFYKNLPENLPDDDMQAEMYIGAIEILQDLKFEQYEVSNFSKKGLYSRHNLNYWNNEEYYGFGVAAHGYKDGIRYGNKISIKDYIKNPIAKLESNKLSEQEKLEEEIFLGFRRSFGIDTSWINRKYNINFDEKYKEIIDKYSQIGLISKTQDGYKLTSQGILVSNVILADFIE